MHTADRTSIAAQQPLMASVPQHTVPQSGQTLCITKWHPHPITSWLKHSTMKMAKVYSSIMSVFMYMITTQKINLNHHHHENLKGLKTELFLSMPVKACREECTDIAPHILNLGARRCAINFTQWLVYGSHSAKLIADERTLNKTEGWVGPRARLDV